MYGSNYNQTFYRMKIMGLFCERKHLSIVIALMAFLATACKFDTHKLEISIGERVAIPETDLVLSFDGEGWGTRMTVDPTTGSDHFEFFDFQIHKGDGQTESIMVEKGSHDEFLDRRFGPWIVEKVESEFFAKDQTFTLFLRRRK